VDPVDAAIDCPAGSSHRIHYRIQAVADDPIDTAHSGLHELANELVCDGCRHGFIQRAEAA
jgi:hypothetical protein